MLRKLFRPKYFYHISYCFQKEKSKSMGFTHINCIRNSKFKPEDMHGLIKSIKENMAKEHIKVKNIVILSINYLGRI